MNPRWHKVLRDYAEALIIALVLAFFIRSFVVQAFKIPSGSMLETLQIGDQLLVNKFIYGVKLPFTDVTLLPISDPKHGDIIVFRYPRDESKDYIKRVIGTPGDTLEMRDNVVYRNGERLDEPYLAGLPPKNFPPTHNFGPITLPEGKYFCMGDNRENSSDSRYWGFVDRSQIIGKAWRIYWSWEAPLNIRWGRLGQLVE